MSDELAFAEEWRGTSREGIRRKIEDAVKRFGIGRVLSSSIHELSEGEKQKVGLSSITMTAPKALIFDEPTANLDPESTEALASEIIRLKKEGKAILVVDHRLYWALRSRGPRDRDGGREDGGRGGFFDSDPGTLPPLWASVRRGAGCPGDAPEKRGGIGPPGACGGCRDLCLQGEAPRV